MKLFTILLLFSLSIACSFCDYQQKARRIGAVTNSLFRNLPRTSFLEQSNDLLRSNGENASNYACKVCEVVVQNLILYRRSGATKNQLKFYVVKLCQFYTDWGSFACSGYVDIELDSLLYIVDNKKDLTAQRVCAISLQNYGCVDPDAKKWSIPLPPPPAEVNYDRYERDVFDRIILFFKNLKKKIPRQSDDPAPLRILHLTDLHYDPLYVPGSNAACDQPLCCQSGTADDRRNAAGYWGDYHVCDMPRHTVDNLFSRIKEKHVKDIDYVYFTGDIISHKSWATTKEDNTRTFKEIYALIANFADNTPVFPILGNHEPNPTNFFSLKNVSDALSTQWIFDLSANEWAKWLPNDTMSTIRKGGYYTVLVKPGFRIVALNSNVCFISNFWLFYQDEDPFDQLKWLVEVLAEAERNDEKVHILSHIPPGDVNCHIQWSNQFHMIVNRFANTISAQFNGHTHFDEIRLFYHPNDTSRVVNVAFNGGSFTTFVGYNPNYRIYDVDPINATVVNYDQYIFNLTEANLSNATAPRWFKFYSFKEAYGLQDMTLTSLNEFVRELSNNENLMYQYFRFLIRDSDVKLHEGCDVDCLKQLLCSITAVETESALKC